ncbi:hypothetical protein ABT288_13440 [Streptomyces sp. NPDC001093]|uniref:hypothetical protein n=1 Tax=Streptomyces sp. NPDC001093 TaxID=3154376 RepID=UPI0033303C1B
MSPTLSSSDPSLADARARLGELAADGAAYISTHWITIPSNDVLGEVLGRG